MSVLIGLSFDAAASPEISFGRSLSSPDASSGWGAAWYPEDELTAAVIRDPYSGESSGMGQVMHNWDRFRPTLVVAHLRGASKRATHRDTHPFVRLWGGRSWVFAHDGDLDGDYAAGLELPTGPQFAPSGPTDSEHVFSWLVANAAAVHARSISDLGYARLRELLVEANAFGPLNVLLSDGEDLVAYRDVASRGSLWWTRLTPPHDRTSMAAAGIRLDLDSSDDRNRSLIAVSSIPLSSSGWSPLNPGDLLVVRRSVVVYDFSAGGGTSNPFPLSATPEDGPSDPSRSVGPGPGALPPRPARRTLRLTHRTSYGYDEAVERSSHRLRLTPVEDSFQRVRSHNIEVNSDGTRFRFEDVFGNEVTGFDISEPFNELVITARSVVEVTAPADRPELLPERLTLPLVWMPWQYQMMTPYLLPAELPESQLREIGAFAHSFVQRNRHDLLGALDDLTNTIYRDFSYTPGFTTLETTPYQVFESRAGVCQDFANLMITACRLLQIPARYRVGYIYTGADYQNTIQSEASHAWVEVYLPHLGWRGYDPTNGCRAGSDHVRVAAGRNYRDATPTAGVIHRGGGGTETLSIAVEVDEVD